MGVTATLNVIVTLFVDLSNTFKDVGLFFTIPFGVLYCIQLFVSIRWLIDIFKNIRKKKNGKKEIS